MAKSNRRSGKSDDWKNKGSNNAKKGENFKEATNQRDTYDERRSRSKHDSTKQSDSPSKVGVNNPEWWTANGQILQDTASVPQMLPIGAPQEFTRAFGLSFSEYGYADKATRRNLSSYYLPGIATIETTHGPGIADGDNDPVNQAFLSQVEFIRANITPNIPYDYADHGMVMLAMGEAYAWYAHMVRVYGVARLFVFNNQYFPRAMLRALGVDPKWLTEETLALFRTHINQFVLQLGAFPVPACHYYDRLMAIYSNIFVDEDSAKAQVYAFVPTIIRALNPYAETGTTLQAVADKKDLPEAVTAWNNDLRRYYRSQSKDGMVLQNFMDVSASIVQGLRNNDDVYAIIGNIINPKTWGNNVYAIPQIQEDQTCIPVPDTGMLHQIMNGTYWFEVGEAGSVAHSVLNIEQQPGIGDGRIIYQPTVSWRSIADGAEDGLGQLASNIAATKRIINSYGSDYVDPMNVVYYTRFTSTPSNNTQEYTYDPTSALQTAPIRTGGIELLGRMHLWAFNKDFNADGTIPAVRQLQHTTVTSMNLDRITSVEKNAVNLHNIERMAQLAAFNYHPTAWFFTYADSNGDISLADMSIMQQWDNVFTLSSYQLSNIQWGAVYSLWGIDGRGISG